MDEQDNEYQVKLGAQISPDTDKQINKFIKKFRKIPENRELRIRINKKHTLSENLDKELKVWNKFEKRTTSGLAMIFKSNAQLKNIKGFYSKMRITALKELNRINGELAYLTDKSSKNPKSTNNLITKLTKQKHAISDSKKELEKYQQQAKDAEDALKNLGKIRDINAVRNDLMRANSKVQVLEKRKNENNVLGNSRALEVRQNALTNSGSAFWNAARDAAIHRNRNGGQEGFSYFRKLKEWTNWSSQENQLKGIKNTTKTIRDQFALAMAAYDDLLAKQKEIGEGTDLGLDSDVEHAKNQVEALKTELSSLEQQKYHIELEIDMRKQNKKIYDDLFAKSSDKKYMEKTFGNVKDPTLDSFNVKLRRTETSYHSGVENSTKGFMTKTEDLVLSDNIQKAKEDTARFQAELNKLNSGDFKKQVEELRTNFEKANEEVKRIEKEIAGGEKNEAKLTMELEKTTAKVQKLKQEYTELQEDMKANPQHAQMLNPALAKTQELLDGINNGFSRIKKFGLRIIKRIGTNIVSQVSSILNPLTNIRKAWAEWMDRFDNKALSNTFDVIKYNLVSVIAPVLEKIATVILKLIAYANVFVKKWTGIDLFSKSAWQAEKLKKGIDSVTSSLDELHTVSNNPDENNTVLDNGMLDVNISPDMEKKLSGIADTIKNIWDKTGKFVKEHPILTAGIIGAALTSGLWAPALIKLAAKGIKNLFSGAAATDAATTGAKGLSGIFGKTLYTGMNGQAVTLGKLIGGSLMTAIGTIGTFFQSSNMVKNWDNWTNGQKALNTAILGGTSALTIFGAAMIGLNPVIGGIIAGTALTIGAFKGFYDQCVKNKTGIESVRKEEEKLKEVQEQLSSAEITQSQMLEQMITAKQRLIDIEAAYHLSGEKINKMVEDGTLKVENMTDAQLQVYNAYVQATKAQNDYAEISKTVSDLKDLEIQKTWDLEIAQTKESKNWNKLKEDVIAACEQQKLSVEQTQDVLARAMAEMDDNTRKTFTENLPDYIREGLDPTKYQSDWQKLGNNFWERMQTLFKGIHEYLGNFVNNWTASISNGWQKNGLFGAVKGMFVPQYDVGTNYVPNDQLAYVHKGEAIIPAKYNKGYQAEDNGLTSVISELRGELEVLRQQLDRGIDVRGEFKQRGSDLVAVVERGQNKNGNQPLSNPVYAR